MTMGKPSPRWRPLKWSGDRSGGQQGVIQLEWENYSASRSVHGEVGAGGCRAGGDGCSAMGCLIRRSQAVAHVRTVCSTWLAGSARSSPAAWSAAVDAARGDEHLVAPHGVEDIVAASAGPGCARGTPGGGTRARSVPLPCPRETGGAPGGRLVRAEAAHALTHRVAPPQERR